METLPFAPTWLLLRLTKILVITSQSNRSATGRPDACYVDSCYAITRYAFNFEPKKCSLSESKNLYTCQGNIGILLTASGIKLCLSFFPGEKKRTVKCELKAKAIRTSPRHPPRHLCAVCWMKGGATQCNHQMRVAFLGIKRTSTFKACLNKTY